MLQDGERETEILLGNKQLLVIFFVGAALLGVAFTGGYMLGRKAGAKPAPAGASEQTAAASPPQASTDTAQSAAQGGGGQAAGGQGGETHSVSPLDENAASSTSAGGVKGADEPLGSRKRRGSRQSEQQPVHMADATASKADSFSPGSGQEFLQVTAVPRDHAVAVAAVLRRKGFRAHAVPKPGEPGVYRVLVGPIRDAGELSSTRDSLRRTGFSQVLVQHYQ